LLSIVYVDHDILRLDVPMGQIPNLMAVMQG